jgi:hypothetical protein
MWIKLSSGMFVPHSGDAGAFSFEQDEMSAGHSRRFGRPPVTSGLRRRADIFGARWDVSKVPKTGSDLFDDLVGAGEHGRGNGDVQSFRRLQVENHQIFGRLLDWQVRWVGSLENLVNIERGASIQIV